MSYLITEKGNERQIETKRGGERIEIERKRGGERREIERMRERDDNGHLNFLTATFFSLAPGPTHCVVQQRGAALFIVDFSLIFKGY